MNVDSIERPDDIVGGLRRLDAAARGDGPVYDYQGLMDRHAARRARTRRRAGLARGTASALVLAMVAVSVWRLNPPDVAPVVHEPVAPSETGDDAITERRLVRADTWMALAAIEDHIASIDDALNTARLVAPRGAEVARLERTRAELVDSYAHVRYAEMVSTSF